MVNIWGIFTKATYQGTISQIWKFLSDHFPKVMLGLCKGGGGQVLLYDRLGKCSLGNFTFGKLLLLGKYPWEVAAWENAFVKVLHKIIWEIYRLPFINEMQMQHFNVCYIFPNRLSVVLWTVEGIIFFDGHVKSICTFPHIV